MRLCILSDIRGFLFFFSSRRRHTRLQGDWSSDVCSSDLMKLVEEGVLSLDEDVNKWLRSWSVPGSAHSEREKVTLRRLLSHTAGTTVHGFPGYVATATVPTVVQVLNGETPANTRAVLVDTQPGALHRYSGGGTTIAQLVIADATGRPFPDVLREKVLLPAGMTRSAFAQPLPDELRANAATAHSPTGQPIPGKYHTYPELAAAGLWTTPSDLARFGIEIQRALAGEHGRIVSPETARQMVTQQTPASGGRYGIGFGLDGPPDSLWFAHGGSNAGFQAYFLMSADRKQGVVVMTNGALGSVLMQEITRSVAREYGWGRHGAVEKDAVRLDSAALAAFVGTYATLPDAPGNPVTMEIFLERGELFVNVPAARWTRRAMRASAPETFFFLASPGELTFERDAAGIVTGISASGLRPQTLKFVRQPSVVVEPR